VQWRRCVADPPQPKPSALRNGNRALLDGDGDPHRSGGVRHRHLHAALGDLDGLDLSRGVLARSVSTIRVESVRLQPGLRPVSITRVELAAGLQPTAKPKVPPIPPGVMRAVCRQPSAPSHRLCTARSCWQGALRHGEPTGGCSVDYRATERLAAIVAPTCHTNSHASLCTCGLLRRLAHIELRAQCVSKAAHASSELCVERRRLG
jgi:hypothetical protein